MRRLLVIDGTFVTVPIPEPAQIAMSEFIAEHLAELDEVLRPYDLIAADIAVPTFERVVYASEVGGAS